MSRLRRQLVEIPSTSENPNSMRVAVLDAIRRGVGVDQAFCYRILRRGDLLIRSECRHSSNQPAINLDHIDGVAFSDARFNPMTPVHGDTTRFRTYAEVIGPQFKQSEAWKTYHAPYLHTDSARVLVYDDVRFAEYVSVITTHPDGVTEERLRVLNAVRCTIASVLAYAYRKDMELLDQRPTAIVAPDGRIRNVSDPARLWLDSDRAAWLSSLVREFDARGGPTEGTMGHARYRIVRLDVERVDYVVMLDRPVVPMVDPLITRLTPRQREIGQLLASGATIPEIATWLGLAPSTVKTHTRNLYRLLGIANRVELVRTFEFKENFSAY